MKPNRRFYRKKSIKGGKI